ncbi:LOW QUALITY PROTEIN: beta-alanine-activating enzyme [Erpetoichthys calabaricus]|uniref:LOW QUALITY PROTEIN: beta-alanine-activating enzyme n=1 Tax=Erpetoichthys calabaricus TaxID=27687 RepID=UPI002233EBB9|nr:LOW QUALITY PROTEIN: beta-alanine-activating enzyme [Erpetoichthys calabaricus]
MHAAAEPMLSDLVREAACKHAEKEAVRYDKCDGQPAASLTYSEVLHFADDLSSFLKAHCDPIHAVLIGLYCQPGLHLASWILGILQVPSAYVPVDPDSPPQLSSHVMKQCCLRYILVQNDISEKFRHSFSSWICHISEFVLEKHNLILLNISWRDGSNILSVGGELATERPQSILSGVSFQDGYLNSRTPGCLAYVLHTSGTTGLPKIVQVPHACIIPNILHLRSIFQVSSNDILFMASPLTFDPSVVELFITLSSGASLLILPPFVKMVPNKLSDVLFSQHKVTVLQATPTLITRFGTSLLQSKILTADTSLRVLALGGEAFPSLVVVRNWRGKGNQTQFFNLYGITEVSCWATCFQIPENNMCDTSNSNTVVPLGMPLLGTMVEVKDSDGHLINEGEGQVFLGGRKRVCFIDSELIVACGTMRATGDWVIVKDSHMYYKGRRDNHVKRHGKQLNLETVVQAVENLSLVDACALTYYKEQKLILFIVAASQQADVGKDVYRDLLKHLPAHAIPDEVMLVKSLPFTSHGKIDTKDLIALYESKIRAAEAHTEVKGENELWESLQTLWKDILDLPTDAVIAAESLFVFSGGDSFKSLRLLEGIEMLTRRKIPELLEIILNCSFIELYNHIIAMIFPYKNMEKRNSCLKRKFTGSSETENPHTKYIPAYEENRVLNVTAVHRGSHFLSFNVDVPKTSTSSVSHYDSHDSFRPPSEASPLNTTVVINLKDKEGGLDQAMNNSVSEISWLSKNTSDTGSFMLKLRWMLDTGKCVDASPLLLITETENLCQTVYIGSHSHRMQAIDMYSGKIKWERLLGDRIESSAAVTKCGRFIVVGCYDRFVYFLAVTTGEIFWMFATGDAVKSCAAVEPSSGLVFVGSHDHHIYALDCESKSCVWKQHCRGTVFSTPCLNASPRRLYVATLGSQLLALNPDNGNVLWKYSVDKPFFASPRCTPGSVCIGSVDGSLYSFSHSGQKLWNFSTSAPIFSSPCVVDSPLQDYRIVFGCYDNFVYCLDGKGHLLWKFETSSRVYSTPFVFNPTDEERRSLVAVTSNDGKLWILDAEKGILMTTFCFPGETFSSPVVWGNLLIVGCRNDFVYCLELSRSE